MEKQTTKEQSYSPDQYIDDYWEQVAAERPRTTQVAEENAYVAKKIRQNTLVEGRPGKRQLKDEVADWWLRLGTRNSEHSAIPDLVRGANLLLENESNPSRKMLNFNDEMRTLIEFSDKEWLSTVEDNERLLLAGQLLLDAAYRTKDARLNDALMKSAYGAFDIIESNESLPWSDECRQKSFMFKYDVQFRFINAQYKEAALSGKQRKQELLEKSFQQTQTRYRSRLAAIKESETKNGFSNELSLLYEMRHVIWQEQAYDTVFVRASLDREDQPKDQLFPSDGFKKQSFDIAVVHYEPNGYESFVIERVQTKARDMEGDEDEYDEGYITLVKIDHILDSTSQEDAHIGEAVKNYYKSEHDEVISAMSREEIGRETPHDAEIIDFARSKIEDQLERPIAA